MKSDPCDISHDRSIPPIAGCLTLLFNKFQQISKRWGRVHPTICVACLTGCTFKYKSSQAAQNAVERVLNLEKAIFAVQIVQAGWQMMKCHKPRERKQVIHVSFLASFSDVSSPEVQNEEKLHVTSHMPKELIVFRGFVFLWVMHFNHPGMARRCGFFQLIVHKWPLKHCIFQRGRMVKVSISLSVMFLRYSD